TGQSGDPSPSQSDVRRDGGSEVGTETGESGDASPHSKGGLGPHQSTTMRTTSTRTQRGSNSCRRPLPRWLSWYRPRRSLNPIQSFCPSAVSLISSGLPGGRHFFTPLVSVFARSAKAWPTSGDRANWAASGASPGPTPDGPLTFSPGRSP